LRIGEMERDGVIAHGAANFLTESMMERGDKYFFAVCNKTGMIAIYNPDKNLFISPLADGPIQYTGSLAGEDMHVENITKYGRSFSLVSTPYSFKLLVQELQAMNVCLRIITEDNIEQMENLMYSNNVKTLTGFEIGEIQKIRNKMIKANANTQPTLFSQIPFPTISPEVIPAIPTLISTTPEFPPPPSQPFVKRFEPVSPESPPPPSPPLVKRFEPVSPEFPPSPSPEEKMEYKVGGKVMYRGKDVKPRVWTIKHIGDKYVTIDTDDYEGIDPENALQVVEKNHICPFHPSYMQEQSYNSPIGYYGDGDLAPSIGQEPRPVAQGPYNGTPDINFSIVVGDHNKVTAPENTTIGKKTGNESNTSYDGANDNSSPEMKEINFKEGFMIKKLE